MRENVMGKLFANLQRIGRALMLPIMVLPAAALLLRFGAPDVLDIPFVTRAGGAVFDMDIAPLTAEDFLRIYEESYS